MKTKRKGLIQKKRTAWLFGIPGLIFVIIFGWYPLITGFYVSLSEISVFRPPEFVGLTNFKYFIDDPVFYTAIRNVFYYSFLRIALTFLLPIFVAILLMEMKKSVIRVMMILWFIPVASMAGIMIWRWFYDIDYGLLNGILYKLGLPTLRWLEDAKLAMFCLVLPALIMYGPGLIYIATIQSIPDELYEAAELEGAGLWQKIWHITLPRLRPIIAVMLILAIIGGMQIFSSPYILTQGGPAQATYSVVMYIYDLGFEGFKYGRATALAIILFFIIMTLIIIQRKLLPENIDK